MARLYYVPTPPSSPNGIRSGDSGSINYFNTKAEAVAWMRRYIPIEVKSANDQAIDWKTAWITEVDPSVDLV